jgi:CRP/FNR family transcriptional regulator
MQKTDMSAYLGLRPETLSRQLRKLEDAGLIERVAADRIRLIDMAALAALAGRAG